MNRLNIDITSLSGKASREAEDLLKRSMQYINRTREWLNKMYAVLCFVIGMRFSTWLMQFVKPGLAGYSEADGLAIGLASFVIAVTVVWFMDIIISHTVMKKRLRVLEDALNKYLRYNPEYKIKKVQFKRGSCVLFQGFRKLTCKDMKKDVLSNVLFFIPISELAPAAQKDNR